MNRNPFFKPFRAALVLVVPLLLAACGGSSDDDDELARSTSEGFFFDSTVEGLRFSTPSRSGDTNERGRFLFVFGEAVSFSLCNVPLGSASGQLFLTPLEIVAGAADVTDRRVTNIARLLIGLDDDGNSADGITLLPSLCTGFPAGIDFDVDPANFRSSNPDLDNYLTARGITLPTAAEAQTHLACSRQDVAEGRSPDGICGIPALSIDDVMKVEGDSGTESFSFTVELSSASTDTVTVGFATLDGTATAGSDYVAASGTLTFSPNETLKTINVTVNGDTMVEPDETFFVDLSNPVNATIAEGRGVGTILNDDAPPGQSTFSIDDVSEPEGNSGTKAFTFTVTRGGDTTITATVDVATADDTATVADNDYEAVATTTLTFAAGVTTQPVSVTVNGDTKVENDEQFFVNLSNPSMNASIVDARGIGTIENDDGEPPPPPGDSSLLEFLFDLVLGLLGQENPVTVENCIEQGSQIDPSGGQGAEAFCETVFGVPAPPQSNEECRAAAEGTPFDGEQADAFCEAVFGPAEPPPPGGGQVRAGVGVADMTPDVGFGAGQYTDKGVDTPDGGMDPYLTHKTQVKSYGVASRLTARALVVEGSNGKRIALLKSDNYLAQDNLMRRVGQILEENDSSIGYEQILHHVTHAHSTTYVSTLAWGVWLFQDAYDLRFFEFQARKLAEAIMTAERNLKPARMGATTVRHKIFKGQIVGPTSADDGTPAGYPNEYGDLGLVVMRFDEVNDEGEAVAPIGVWVNWGEHPEGLDGYDLHSADFVAYLERFVERDIDAPLVFSQGDVGSAEKSGNDQQRLRDDGTVCEGPGATPGGCPDGEGTWRDWNHKGYVQNERNVRYLADAVVKGWKVIGGELPVDAPATGIPPNNFVPEVQVPFSTSFPVDYRNAFVPGPLSHPYPSVSNCRTEPTIEGDTGLPILGLPDCERIGVPGENPVNAQLAQIYNAAKVEGIPVPDHYDAPGFTAVEENLRLMLQAFRLGDVVLGSCACEAQVDLILNFETRADDVTGNIYDGFDWACVAEDKGMAGFVPRDPEYAAACALQREKYYDVTEFPTNVPGNNFDADAIKHMRKQVHNDARGWDAPENALFAGTEPSDPDDIWGNFTKEELPPNRGYKLAVGVGHAGDYNGYTVSYREYMRGDHYRKALTSYGPHTADYMVTRLVRMAGAMKGGEELAPEPHDVLAQVDEARQTALAEAHGLLTKNAYDAYYALLPPDVGPRAPLAQPQDTSLFDAATFTWRGGSTAVDNPKVVVERCEGAEDRDCTGGQWTFFADQTGEVQTRVQWPEGIPGLVETYTGQHEWQWTANFEAYDSFPASLGGTPAGFYRFVANGCINDGSAPEENFSNRIMKLLGMGGDPACLGGATAYTLTSDAFEVFGQADLVESVTSDASGNLSITVSATSVPRSYDSVFPYIRDDGGIDFCKECSFRPWAMSDAPPESVTVVVNGQTLEATGSGTDWTADVGLGIGETAHITATYEDGRISRTFAFTRADGPPPDRDGDGVPDIDDNCPDDPGPASNNGCPEQGAGFPIRFDELCAGPGCLSDIDVLGLQAVLDDVWNTLFGGGTPGGLPDQCDPSGTAPDGSRCLSDIPVAGDLFGDGGGEPPTGTANASCTNGTNLDGGRSYQVKLETHDGETVSFQVLEPTNFDCATIANGAHPLMLHGPGYSGSRSTSGFGSYRDRGYTVISWDPRGFGDSTGSVRVMDPEFEGQYLLQILDWAEDNLDYLAWRNESNGNFMARPAGANVASVAGGPNLVVGAQGGSYGGGYQLLILAVDKQKRLDAIAPDITWHDLRNSLNPGDVIKTLWDVALTGVGEGVGHSSGGVPTNDGQDPFIKETLARGASTNEWPRQSLDWFHYRGLGYWCAAAGLPAMPYPAYGEDAVPMLDPLGSYNVPPRQENGRPGFGDHLAQPAPAADMHFAGLDVLLTQGMPDTLFNFNEAWWNTQCLRAAGANVSLYTHTGGHALPVAQSPDGIESPVGGNGCSAGTLDWFEAKLRPDKPAAPRDEVCMVLGADDTVSFIEDSLLAPQPELGLAGGESPKFTAREFSSGPVPNGLFAAANTTGNLPVAVPLGVVGQPGILAGLPHLSVTIASLTGVNETAQDCSAPTVPTLRLGCDSITFAGIGIRKAGAQLPIFKLIDDQLQPLRGLGEHDVDLVGIAERLQPGDELALLLYGAHTQFFGSYSRDVSIPAVSVSGTVKLPIYAVDGDGKPDTESSAENVLGGDEPPPPPAGATEGYGTGLLGAIAELIADLNAVIVALFQLDVEGAAAALQVALTDFGNNLSGLPDDAGSPGGLIGLASEPDEVVVQALSAARAVEPVVLTGAQLPGWSQPAAAGIAQNHFSGFENFTGATEPGYGPRDAHAGIMLYPPNWAPGDDAVNIGGGAQVGNIAAYARRNGAWEEIRVQVDERYPYFLANGNSTFSFYSGIDPEISYAWDVESWGMTKGTCYKAYDPAGIDVAPRPGLYTPLTPGADPNRGISKAIGDPIAGLDNDDEIVFMAGDAGELYQGVDFPSDWNAVQLVRLNDPLNPVASGFVYLVQKDGGSSFTMANGYVKYQRHPNADQWIDRSFFENGGVEQDQYKRNALGTSNTGYGPNLDGTVCPDGTPASARQSTAHGSEGGDRFPRDGVVVTTDTYRWEATGRWMVRDLRVRDVNDPAWASKQERDLLDRWKGRAFQQSPDSTISLVGFEDEQVNWEANSSLLGERCGPVRCIREVWGADSGTNVTKVETFYRDAITYRYYVRVHPIPPDGLYTSWDYNRSAMVPTMLETAAGVPGGRYYTMLRPQGVPIDGINDDVGQMDVFPGCRAFYDSPASGTLLPVLAQLADGARPVTDNVPFVGTPNPYDLESCAAFFDTADPTFNLALGFENWEQVSGKGNLGSLVYIFEMKGATSALNPLVVPYYRDDACLDDGTGDDPVRRPWPGEGYLWNNGAVKDAYDALAGEALDHSGATFGDCIRRQGAHAAHGVHYFFTHDTDNAMAPVTTTEIDGMQWQFMVPTQRPQNIAEPYANTVRARLVPVVIPMSPPSGGGIQPPGGVEPPPGIPPEELPEIPPEGFPPGGGGGGWVGVPGVAEIDPDRQCGRLLGNDDFEGCLDDLPF